MPGTADNTKPNIYYVFIKYITFHLKGTLYGSSLAYPNCQHCHSQALGPLLTKIRVTWTQVLCNTLTVNLITTTATKWLTAYIYSCPLHNSGVRVTDLLHKNLRITTVSLLNIDSLPQGRPLKVSWKRPYISGPM